MSDPSLIDIAETERIDADPLRAQTLSTSSHHWTSTFPVTTS